MENFSVVVYSRIWKKITQKSRETIQRRISPLTYPTKNLVHMEIVYYSYLLEDLEEHYEEIHSNHQAS